jgi:hypothetical protein
VKLPLIAIILGVLVGIVTVNLIPVSTPQGTALIMVIASLLAALLVFGLGKAVPLLFRRARR